MISTVVSGKKYNLLLLDNMSIMLLCKSVTLYLAFFHALYVLAAYMHVHVGVGTMYM